MRGNNIIRRSQSMSTKSAFQWSLLQPDLAFDLSADSRISLLVSFSFLIVLLLWHSYKNEGGTLTQILKCCISIGCCGVSSCTIDHEINPHYLIGQFFIYF